MLGTLLVTIAFLIRDLQNSRWSLHFLSFILLLGRSAHQAPHRLFYLYVLLSSRQDILHADDIMLHQMPIEGTVGLQSSSKCGYSDVITTVINQRHLGMEIADVTLQGLSLLHLDGEEVVVVLLEFLSRGILVEKGIADFLEAPKRPQWKGVEPV